MINAIIVKQTPTCMFTNGSAIVSKYTLKNAKRRNDDVSNFAKQRH